MLNCDVFSFCLLACWGRVRRSGRPLREERLQLADAVLGVCEEVRLDL